MAKLNWIWSSLPAQLARENKKFLYRAVRAGARAREYEDALTWLSQAGLVHRVFRLSRPGLPLSAYDDLAAFKLYAVDVGLLRRLALLDPVAFNEGSRLFTEFKGALTENFVLQGLARQFEALSKIMYRDYSMIQVLPRLTRPLAVAGRGIARQGAKVVKNGKFIGWVTSGTMVPYWVFQGE